MCALSHYLEREGIQTTGISLVRENAVHMRPPRSLWVSFPLGRPLGKPNDAAFQHGVIAAALELLARPSGPVLADYPYDAPAADASSAPACPVAFPKAVDGDAGWRGCLADEFALLKPWHELSLRRRRGRTLVGASSDDVLANLQRMGELLDADQLPLDDLKWFKLATEDAKAFAIEALTAQPGEHDHRAVQRTLWRETQLGAALAEFHQRFQQDPKWRLFARIVAPREAVAAAGDASNNTEAKP